eukprot:4375925-Pleurochrysis_carterae.AAC.1
MAAASMRCASEAGAGAMALNSSLTRELVRAAGASSATACCEAGREACCEECCEACFEESCEDCCEERCEKRCEACTDALPPGCASTRNVADGSTNAMNVPAVAPSRPSTSERSVARMAVAMTGASTMAARPQRMHAEAVASADSAECSAMRTP